MESWILMMLVVMPGVSSGPWSVTYQDQCALRGASILLQCSYNYPLFHFVTSVNWSKVQCVFNPPRLVSLDKLLSPPQFRYLGNFHGDCTLEIYNLRPIDEGAYHFSFVTSLDRWRSETSLYLQVKELTIVVQPSIVTEGEKVTLTCVSGCPTPTNSVWFRDGQPVPKPVFQARREDAGRYYCAVRGQETVRSNPVALNVQYAPKKVRLSVSPSGNVSQGGSVTFNCSSEANPLVSSNGYSLYKDGQFLSSGEQHTISDVQPSHSGLYHCQAWNNISSSGVDLINSTKAHLDVWYRPTNISVSVDPPQVAEGSGVNLTCSSTANPAAVSYTWYKRTDDPSSNSMIQVGSGPVLTLPSLEASHIGPYLCQARNSIGESFSTEVLLTMTEQGNRLLPVLAGLVAFVLVALVIALLLFWRKQRAHTEDKQTEVDYSGKNSSSSAKDQSDVHYANIFTIPSPLVTTAAGVTSSKRKPEHNVPTSYEAEHTYSAVTFKPRNPSCQHHTNNSRSKTGESNDSVIYSTLAISSLSRS